MLVQQKIRREDLRLQMDAGHFGPGTGNNHQYNI